MKEWLNELLVDTIVAAALTLLSYILGLEKTWAELAQTFGVAFVVMFFLGLYARRKSPKAPDESDNRQSSTHKK